LPPFFFAEPPLFLAAFLPAAFFVAFFIVRFSLTSNLRPFRSQCDPYIRLFEIKVKKKMKRGRRFAVRNEDALKCFELSGGTPPCSALAERARDRYAPPQMLRRRWLALITLLVLTGACRKKVSTAKAPRIGTSETGIASWYGHPYHGRRAANGEIYDMEKLTAAHRTLPFDTWVEIRNLTNDKSVEVRVTDRGPFIDGRIIDVSHAAARAIDLIGPGTARVRLTIIAPPPREELPAVELFAVQAGAFQDRARAERVRSDMEARFAKARIVERAASPIIWRVLVGEEQTLEAATALAQRIEAAGTNAFVVRLDSPAPAITR
jgi:rare lipoprotein A